MLTQLNKIARVGLLLPALLFFAQGCAHIGTSPILTFPSEAAITSSLQTAATPAEKIVLRARMEAARLVRYDAAYVQIPYPNGDVPADRGACTDVVVRALDRKSVV